jgi:hypothetical protein
MRAIARALGATVLFAAAVSVVGLSSAYATGTQSGVATLVQSNGTTPLTSGDASTNFEINLPAQSHCSGDTANNGFNVYSFLALNSVNPGTLTFDSGNGPNNNVNAFPLVDSTGTPFNAENTAPVTGAVYPGSQPIFNFLAFGGPPSPFTPGTYNIGLECTTSTGAADVFWDAPIVITASATAPGGFTFSVPAGTQVPESPFALALPLSALSVLAIGGYVVVRRRRTAAISA